jgi:two-component system sensor histidine kinase AlgZ
VFLLIVVGFLAALVFALAQAESVERFWISFGLAAIFIQWVVLASAALICLARRLFPASPLISAAWIMILVVPGFTSLATIAGFWLFLVDPAQSAGWIFLRNLVISVIVSLVLMRYLILQQRWRQQIAAQAGTRLDALQARIHPHFLFNALNTVSELLHEHPDQAEQALLDLSDLLRSGLRVDSEHTLEEELDLIRAYLRIEALRLGPRLRVAWSVDEHVDLKQVRPALLIQPLVENAVIHGIAPHPEGGELKITISMIRFGRIRVRIENPIPPSPASPRSGNGTALENIRQRLALAYEEGAGLKTDQVGDKFRAILTLPAGKSR